MKTPAPATMGRLQLWAMIRTHSKDHLCAYCVAWALRWTRAEYDIEKLHGAPEEAPA